MSLKRTKSMGGFLIKIIFYKYLLNKGLKIIEKSIISHLRESGFNRNGFRD